MRQSRPILLLASGPSSAYRRHGYATAASAIAWTAGRTSLASDLSPSSCCPDPLRARASTGGAQGVTTSAIERLHHQRDRQAAGGCDMVVAVHLPSGTQYRAVARTGGAYSLPNMRVGGPYRVTASMIGFEPKTAEDVVFLSLGETQRVDLALEPQAVRAGGDRGDGGRGGQGPRRRPDRRRHVHQPGAGGAPPLDQAKHPRPDPARPAERRQLQLRRPELALQQRLARRLLLQQSVRPRRSGAGRPDQRRAGALRRGRAGAGLDGAVRRAGGRVHRRQHQHRDQERHQRLARLALHASAGPRALQGNTVRGPGGRSPIPT